MHTAIGTPERKELVEKIVCLKYVSSASTFRDLPSKVEIKKMIADGSWKRRGHPLIQAKTELFKLTIPPTKLGNYCRVDEFHKFENWLGRIILNYAAVSYRDLKDNAILGEVSLRYIPSDYGIRGNDKKYTLKQNKY